MATIAIVLTLLIILVSVVSQVGMRPRSALPIRIQEQSQTAHGTSVELWDMEDAELISTISEMTAGDNLSDYLALTDQIDFLYTHYDEPDRVLYMAIQEPPSSSSLAILKRKILTINFDDKDKVIDLTIRTVLFGP